MLGAGFPFNGAERNHRIRQSPKMGDTDSIVEKH